MVVFEYNFVAEIIVIEDNKFTENNINSLTNKLRINETLFVSQNYYIFEISLILK